MALSTLTVALGVVGSLLAPLTLGPAQFVSLLLTGAFVGAFAAMLARSVSQDRALDSWEAAGAALRSAAVGATCAVATGALVLALGSYGWGIVIASALAYPLLRALFGAVSRSEGRQVGDETAAVRERPRLSLPPFERCSTSELAAAWSASYDLLQVTTSPLVKARIAALRATYLDELERRDRLGVRRWLIFGSDPASDAGHYFRSTDEGGEPSPGVV